MDLDEVDAIACSFPGVEIGEIWRGWKAWNVGGKSFAWERAYSKADIKRFGDQPYPQEPIVAVRLAGMADKEALLASTSDAVFNIAHFDNYAGVLVEVEAVEPDEMHEILLEGWLARASKQLIEEYDARRS